MIDTGDGAVLNIEQVADIFELSDATTPHTRFAWGVVASNRRRMLRADGVGLDPVHVDGGVALCAESGLARFSVGTRADLRPRPGGRVEAPDVTVRLNRRDTLIVAPYTRTKPELPGTVAAEAPYWSTPPLIQAGVCVPL